jgi:hypothetical protein
MKREHQASDMQQEEEPNKQAKTEVGSKPTRKERKEKYKKNKQKKFGKKPKKEDGDVWLKRGELSSEVFEQFYREQKIMPDDEFDAFISSLTRTLPTTFRINQYVTSHVLTLSRSIDENLQISLRDKIENYFVPRIRGLEVEEDEQQEEDVLNDKGEKVGVKQTGVLSLI